jgi:thioredoxin-like negative regulator of GroEL
MRVISATHDNMPFLNNLLQKNRAVVFFVAPWCGHCKSLEPTLNKIMGRFSTSRRNGLLARVSEGNIKNLNCDKDIRGFPTIRVLNNGKKEKDYVGPRDENSLNAFLASVFNENIRKKPIKVLKRNLKKIRKKRKKRTVYSSLLRKKAKKAVTKRKAKKAVKKKAVKKKATKRKAKRKAGKTKKIL